MSRFRIVFFLSFFLWYEMRYTGKCIFPFVNIFLNLHMTYFTILHCNVSRFIFYNFIKYIENIKVRYYYIDTKQLVRVKRWKDLHPWFVYGIINDSHFAILTPYVSGAAYKTAVFRWCCRTAEWLLSHFLCWQCKLYSQGFRRQCDCRSADQSVSDYLPACLIPVFFNRLTTDKKV